MPQELVWSGEVPFGWEAWQESVPFPARSARLASSSTESLDAEERVSAMPAPPPPPPYGRSGVGGGCSEGDHSTSGRDLFPQPGPPGLGSGERSVPRADRSHSEYRGRSSPAPSGAAEDDRDSTSGSVDLDRDDSFWTVLHLIREFRVQDKNPADINPTGHKPHGQKPHPPGQNPHP